LTSLSEINPKARILDAILLLHEEDGAERLKAKIMIKDIIR